MQLPKFLPVFLFAALACLMAASSAKADCPTHATYPAPVEPDTPRPPEPPECDPPEGAGTGPASDPPDMGGNPQAGGSTASCNLNLPNDPTPTPPPNPGPEPCSNKTASPDSLPTLGERVRLHVVGGGGPTPVRWGKLIGFGDGFRLNYMQYIQLTSDGRYARLYDPATQKLHNFRTDPAADSTQESLESDESGDILVRSYSSCYIGDEDSSMHKLRIETRERSASRPHAVRIAYPDGSRVDFEYASHDFIVGDLAGPLYRVAKRVTREGTAIRFLYNQDAMTIQDASGNEYVCHLDAEQRINEISITSGEQTRRWTYAFALAKVVEKNEQTGISVTLQSSGNYPSSSPITGGDLSLTRTYRWSDGLLTSWNNRGDTYSYANTRLANGNIKQVETRDGRVITREYDANGLVWQENQLGEREEFRYNLARKLEYRKDALGNEWHYEYAIGAPERLVSSRTPSGSETRYEYDNTGRMLMKSMTQVDNANWSVVEYSYDPQERLREERRQIGDGRESIVRYFRFENGLVRYRLEKIDSSSWAATAYVYNSGRQVIEEKGPYLVTDPEHPEIGEPTSRKVFAYDPWGNRISATNELGDTVHYEYDGGNRLIAQVNPLGQRTEYTYDGLGQKIKQKDAIGSQTEWIYDTYGRVTSIKGSSGVAGCTTCAMAAGASGQPGTYAWSTSGLLTQFTNMEGNRTTYAYDAARRKSKETDALGNITLFDYNAAGNLITITDPLNYVTRMTYDAEGRNLTVVNPLGNVSGSEYNLAGRLVRTYDAAGGEQRLTHNLQGWLLSRKVKVDDATWRESRYAYNLRGDLVETVDAYGTDDSVVTRMEYDSAGRLIRTTLDPDGLALVTESQYDAAGQLVKRSDAKGNATLFAYDAAGNLISRTSPEGRVIAYEYDDVARLIETVLDPDGIAQARYIARDAAGRVIDESDGVASRSFVYNKIDKVVKILVPGQADKTMAYDALGRLRESGRLAANGTVAMSTKREYDKAGRMTRFTDENNQNTLYEYNAASQPVKVTDPLGAVTQFEYDAAGRQVKVILPHGGERVYAYNLVGELIRTEGGPEGTKQYGFDSFGREISVLDANGRSRKTVYDKVGRALRRENEMGQPVSYVYDAAGNMLSLTDANGNTTTYVYDRDGQLIKMTYPSVAGQSENIEQYQYDGAGRLVCKITPNGDSIRVLYDVAGNVAAMHSGEAVADVASIPAGKLIARYERNGAGDVLKEEDPNTAMLYGYDSYGRLTEARDRTLNKSVRYVYDNRDLRTKMDVVDYVGVEAGTVSMSVAYGYDNAGRLASVKKGTEAAATYGYDAAGRRTKLLLPNGVVTSYIYDNNDRLRELATVKDAIILSRFVYTHDASGNRTGIAYADCSQSLYSFDEAYRLTRDKRLDSSNDVLYDESYTYDAVGNRLTKARTGWNPVDVTYSYNARNQLVATSGTEAKTYSYDANGNTIGIDSASGDEIMTYDVLNRLTRYAGLGGTEGTLYRGGAWHRWAVTETPVDSAANRISFLYDGDNAVADYSGLTPALARMYVTPGLDQNLTMYEVSDSIQTPFYYSQDGLGSVRTLTDSHGMNLNQYDYTAFGEGYRAVGSVQQRYGYTGRENRNTLRSIFYRYRNYDLLGGRFDRRDPTGYENNKDGTLYAYGTQSPVNFLDPYGLYTLSELCSNSMNLDYYALIYERARYLQSGYKNDSQIMAEIHKIKSMYQAGTPDWKEKGKKILEDYGNFACPNGFIDVPHQFRNALNVCPKMAPTQPDSNCPKFYDTQGNVWESEGRYNIFHHFNLCFRGTNKHVGSQCCYNPDGTLNDSVDWLGTYDYTTPGVSKLGHAWDDVLTHIVNPDYVFGITITY